MEAYLEVDWEVSSCQLVMVHPSDSISRALLLPPGMFK